MHLVFELLALTNDLRVALDMETLRDYHNFSFSDPPSYHEDDEDLWNCSMCVTRYIERAKEMLELLQLD